jgi:NAD(P)-dependent dehydrogenase (short-subunit alcohol dehydrogenase family)
MLRFMAKTTRGGAERSIIVTGGTGALGSAVVAAFLEAGDRVLVPWVVKAEADAMPSHARLLLMEADVADSAGAASVVERAVDASGGVDVLVNCVGGFGGGAPVHETDLALWDDLYHLNVRTAVAMSRAVLPGMLERECGVIVSVASRAARDCPAGIAAYSASKAAVVALTRSLSNELAGTGVRVNAVEPTTIDTPANREGMPDADFSEWTPPAEIARVILWLAGRDAEIVSGGVIPV